MRPTPEGAPADRTARARRYRLAVALCRRRFRQLMIWREDLAVDCRDWDTWLHVVFVWRPAGYCLLALMCSQVALFQIGLSVTPRRAANRLMEVATRRRP